MDYAPLLYWLPSGHPVPAHLVDPGFSPPRKALASEPEDPGNTGARVQGALVTPCRGPFDLNVEPDFQTWHKRPSGCWIGVDRRAKLDPAVFARDTQRTGHMVKLGGASWLIPCARLAGGGLGLPKRRAFGPDGAATWEVEAAYKGLSDAAEQWWQIFMCGGSDAGLTDALVDGWCGAALSVNYRLGADDAIALGLFDDATQARVMAALIDLPTINSFLASQKKTAAT